MINVGIAPDLSGQLAQLKADLIADADAKAAASSAALNNQTATIQTELDAITTVNGQISSEVQAINSHTTTKTDAVLNAVNAKGVIKSIQRGAVSSNGIVVINAVNPDKAMVNLTCSVAGGRNASSTWADSCSVTLISGTELSVDANLTFDAGWDNSSLKWEVIEYE